MPVSSTSINSVPLRPSSWPSQETRVLTQPRSVNLMALLSKFTSTWRNRRRSSNNARGRLGESSN